MMVNTIKHTPPRSPITVRVATGANSARGMNEYWAWLLKGGEPPAIKTEGKRLYMKGHRGDSIMESCTP